MPVDTRRRSLRDWLQLNLLVLAAYSVLGAVIVLFGIGPAKISPIYPPAGIAVAATFILGPRILPAIFVGQFLNGFPLFWEPGTTLAMYLLANVGTGIGGMLEAVAAVWILRRLAGTWYPFDRSRDVVVFLLGSSLGAAAVSAVIGTISMWLCGFVDPGEFMLTLATFLLSDASGIAVFAALVLAWYRAPHLDRRIVETVTAVVIVAVAIAEVATVTRYPVDFLYLPLLLWAAFRDGPRGVTAAAAVTTAVTVVTTVAGVGSFVGRTPNVSILLFEVFMAVITFTGLLTVGVRAEQQAAEEALAEHNRLLERRVAERTAEVATQNRLLEEKQARIDDDLQTARALQAAILPTDFSAYPDTGIAAAMRPALEMAGDFYDVFPLGSGTEGGRLGLAVADVSGKGVATAFYMAVTRTLLRAVAQRGLAPAEGMEQVNEALCRENPVGMFVTALYAELDEATGAMRFVNAGHCEPLMVRADGRVEVLPRVRNPPLGVLEGRRFIESTAVLGEGDLLCFYTDGVTEAVDRTGELFHQRRLLKIARSAVGRAPTELMGAVIAGVDAFSAGTMQADDITLLVVRRNAKRHSPS